MVPDLLATAADCLTDRLAAVARRSSSQGLEAGSRMSARMGAAGRGTTRWSELDRPPVACAGSMPMSAVEPVSSRYASFGSRVSHSMDVMNEQPGKLAQLRGDLRPAGGGRGLELGKGDDVPFDESQRRPERGVGLRLAGAGGPRRQDSEGESHHVV